MALLSRFPVHISIMISNDHDEEITEIAEKNYASKGAVMRHLLRLGLVKFHQNGEKLPRE